MRWTLFGLRTAVYFGFAGALVCITLVGCSGTKGNSADGKAADNSSSQTNNATEPNAASQPAAAADKGSQKTALLKEETVPPPTLVGEITVEELYPDKKVQVRRMVKRYSDDSMVNNGLYTEFYQNGHKLEEGKYIDGKKDGAWHMWYANGQEAKVENYVNGQLDGQWTLFNEKGLKESEVSFKAGKRDGHWITYADDGKQPRMQEEYHDGKLDGTSITWSTDGKKLTEAHFENGMPQGLQQMWYPNGQLAGQSDYKNGKRDGKEIRWNEKGEKLLEEDFVNGTLVRNPESGGK
jgi:antitoxin component YwqK of YwqJK toxin-antitoxin module